MKTKNGFFAVEKIQRYAYERFGFVSRKVKKKRKYMGFCISFAVPLFSASANYAGESRLISCISKSNHEITIELYKPSEFGVPLHCVSAPFLRDLTACSPNKGWGLSRGTGLADLEEITTDWKYAHSHLDGKFRAALSAKTFSAAASYGTGLPNTEHINGKTNWVMKVDRITGEGWIYAEENVFIDEAQHKNPIQLKIHCFPVSRVF